MNTGHYRYEDLIQAFKRLGISQGDLVFSHVGLGMLGYPVEGKEIEVACQNLYEAMMDVLGPTGTWIVPTYSYSFCKNRIYDPDKTDSDVGSFTNYFRCLPNVKRSDDPIFSVAGVGPRVDLIINDLPDDCFGEDCVYDRLVRLDAKLCNIGVGFRYATFVHHVEQIKKVPYRFPKLFTGYMRKEGKLVPKAMVYNVRVLAPNCYPDLSRLEEAARDEGLISVEKVGLGEITAISCADMKKISMAKVGENPWYLARGPEEDLVLLEEARVKKKMFPIDLPVDSGMMEMINALWRIPRDIISDGYDASLNALSKQIEMRIHEYPTGTECWTWFVPEKWTCHEAYVETLSGKRLISYQDNPLHLVSYSLPLNRIMKRRELLQHLHSIESKPDAIPFKSKYYERDWGFCCSHKMKSQLNEDQYKVVIDSEFSYGTLKIGEISVSGETDYTILLCAHLCHPHMVNDDLSGVAVGIELMRELSKKNNLKFNYKFLIMPETIGAVAYLSQFEKELWRFKGGISIVALGLNHPHALQMSFKGGTAFDRSAATSLEEYDERSWTGPYREVMPSDERHFNAPGVQIPMLTLSRALPANHPDYPYREYHTSLDTPQSASEAMLTDSKKCILNMVERFERDADQIIKWESTERNKSDISNGLKKRKRSAVKNKFKGEVFCSRYGLNVDRSAEKDAHKILFDIMYRLDGSHSVEDISSSCNIPMSVTESIVKEFHRKGLVDYDT